MGNKTFVIGVGMTKFEKPATRDWDYPDMGREAIKKALDDASVGYESIRQVAAGYCYGDTTCGERAVYEVGLSGVPIYNVNNACATGSSALFIAKQFVEGGIADCALAVGFEKMEKGSLGAKFTDRTSPMDKHFELMDQLRARSKAPGAPQMFANTGAEHMERYGTTEIQFARVAAKNHKHSVNNPYAQFQEEYSVEEILASPRIHGPLTKLQCCPTSDGAAAVIIASEDFVRRNHLEDRAIEIAGMAMTTDRSSTFADRSMIKVVGYDMTRASSQKAYEQAGVGPEDLDVIELHDCFSCNELITYEALGLCPEGKGGEFIDSGAATYGGSVVVNPSGGLISKGHPLGATGLAQCTELTWQLRGKAEKRQVEGAKVALQHNLGLGGAAVVAVYRRFAAN